ncbi:MAG: hypothetical protein ACFFA3_14440 [Promethearchaeota archaeon]
MSLLEIFKPERRRKRLEELKILFQLNPEYYKYEKKLKLEKEVKAYI